MDLNKKIVDLLNDSSFKRWLKDGKSGKNTKWESWRKENPENEQLLADITRMEKGIPFKKQKIDNTRIKSSWAQLEKKLEKPAPSSPQINPRRNWLKLAASIAILMLAGFGTYQFLNQPKLVTHQTDFTENKTITLPEGTIITLGSNSQLTYLDNILEVDNRKVSLVGEAYFQVAEQADGKQFIVETVDIEVQVVGTSFNINSHRNASIVSLTEGNVNLVKEGYQNQPLIAGQTARFNNGTNKFDLKENQTTYWSSWKFQRWSFGDATPMEEIIQRIEETFGLTVHIDNKDILEKSASGDIAIDNQAVLFESLSYLLNVDFEQNGSEITIKSQ